MSEKKQLTEEEKAERKSALLSRLMLEVTTKWDEKAVLLVMKQILEAKHAVLAIMGPQSSVSWYEKQIVLLRYMLEQWPVEPKPQHHAEDEEEE